MADDIRLEFARLLRDKQDELTACRDQWAKTARSIIRMLMDGAAAIDRFDSAAFAAAVEDLQQAATAIEPLEGQVKELRARLL